MTYRTNRVPNVSAPHDYKRGGGYAKAQKSPSMGTGLGSEYPMGSSKTGIYPEESEHEPEEDDLPFESESDLAKFIARTNSNYKSFDSVRPRADMSSYGHSSNKFSTFLEQRQLPKASSGTAPFPSSVMYPNGFDLAVGGSSTNFGSTRTAPGKVGGTGTQFGFARKPLDTEDDEIRFFSLVDIYMLPEDERNFIKQQLRLKKALLEVESLL